MLFRERPGGIVVFQSPLHRGSLWNRRGLNPVTMAVFTFSPLFIGEVSGTERIHSPCMLEFIFQSPLHRGSLWNMYVIATVKSAFSLSVPSSSGKSLELYQGDESAI